MLTPLFRFQNSSMNPGLFCPSHALVPTVEIYISFTQVRKGTERFASCCCRWVHKLTQGTTRMRSPPAPLFRFQSSSMNPVISFVLCSQSTPLHFCCYYGRLDVCKHLIASKADVTARDKYCLPAPCSARCRHIQLTRCLTRCLTGIAPLPSKTPSTKRRATLLHIYGASARLYELRSRRSCVSVRYL